MLTILQHCYKFVNNKFYIFGYSMNINELQNYLKQLLNRDITQTEIANALNKDRSNICNKAKRGTELKVSEIESIEQYFNVNLFTNLQQNSISSENTITLEYIHINPSCGKGTICLDEAEVTPITLGTELIKNILKISNPKNLKIFKASGDSMESTIYDDDILLVDVGTQSCINSGVYVLSRNNDYLCKRLRINLNGDLDVISDNKNYPIETIKKISNDVEIKIVGKVVKNLSRGL